uniref:Gustatory receptor n=1 Tax=Tetranychus urticae TaxID=32264 RepID=T1KRJ8_TETUR
MDEHKSSYRSTLTRPSSIVGKSLLRENKWSQILHLFPTIVLLVVSIMKLPNIYNDIKTNRYNNVLIKYERIMNFIVYLSLSLVSLNYKYESSYYIEFINLYQKITNTNYFGLFCNSYLIKWSKINKSIVLILALSGLFVNLLFIGNRISLSEPISSLNLIFLIVVASFNVPLWFQILFEICTFLQSTFLLLENSLVRLKKQTNQLNEFNVKSLRLLHVQIIESIIIINKFYRYNILSTYVYSVGHNVCLLGILSHSGQSISKFPYYVKFIEQLFHLMLITFHMVRVNQLSVRVFDRVYKLSLSLNSSHSTATMNEINLFLLRIHRNDVGFTFAGLCLIAPSFISSLASIALTIGLALPSLVE